MLLCRTLSRISIHQRQLVHVQPLLPLPQVHFELIDVSEPELFVHVVSFRRRLEIARQTLLVGEVDERLDQ